MKRTILAFVLLVATVVAANTADAQSASTAFTYQGRLTDGGSPVTGAYDFHFELYRWDDRLTTWVWTDEVYEDDLVVTDGYFTAILDFTAGPTSDEPMALEIGVRPGASTGAYDPLSPMQELTKVPQAQRAETATSVDGGAVDASELRIWGGLVVDGGGNWLGQGSTVPCAGCIGDTDIGSGVITSNHIDASSGIFVSKSQLYEVVQSHSIPAGGGFGGGIATCNDGNDLPISGGCRYSGMANFGNIEDSYPSFWTDPSQPATWNCSVSLSNACAMNCTLYAHIICLTVP